jgi:hypothetical protein
MRALILMGVLAALPAYADELQIDLTGLANTFAPPQTPSTPFSAVFDINTLSGAQS